MASSNNVKDASEPSTDTTTTDNKSSTCTTCADTTTAATTKGHRRPRPVSASCSDRRDCLLDRIAVMRQQETTSAYKTCHYFASANGNNSSSSSTAPDASCRAKMVQWCTQVTDYCEFSRETVAVALSYVDRYLSIISRAERKQQQQQQQYHHYFTDEQRAPLHNRKEYQLLCMTALHTAVKIREPLEMDTETVAELSRGIYTAADVAWMEQQLLQVLGWRLAGPTSLDFCRHLVELVAAAANGDSDSDRVADAMVELCQLQTELASADYRFVPLNPSTVAVSSILNAIEALGEDVIVPTARLVMVETIRRVTKIDICARVCRDELMKGLASAGVDFANIAAIDSNDASCSSGGGGTSDDKFRRRESIGSAEESPISVAAHHHGCCA